MYKGTCISIKNQDEKCILSNRYSIPLIEQSSSQGRAMFDLYDSTSISDTSLEPDILSSVVLTSQTLDQVGTRTQLQLLHWHFYHDGLIWL